MQRLENAVLERKKTSLVKLLKPKNIQFNTNKVSAWEENKEILCDQEKDNFLSNRIKQTAAFKNLAGVYD